MTVQFTARGPAGGLGAQVSHYREPPAAGCPLTWPWDVCRGDWREGQSPGDIKVLPGRVHGGRKGSAFSKHRNWVTGNHNFHTALNIKGNTEQGPGSQTLISEKCSPGPAPAPVPQHQALRITRTPGQEEGSQADRRASTGCHEPGRWPRSPGVQIPLRQHAGVWL